MKAYTTWHDDFESPRQRFRVVEDEDTPSSVPDEPVMERSAEPRRGWVRYMALAAGVVGLIPEAIYNIGPSITASMGGEVSMSGEIALRTGVILAVATLPRARDYRLAVWCFVAASLFLAYMAGELRNTNNTAGALEKMTLSAQYEAKLAELRPQREGWKAFTAVSQKGGRGHESLQRHREGQ